MKVEKILLVEDDPHILRSLERLLVNEGLEVKTAATGFEAIEIAQNEEFALIVTDVRMPGMDGLEALGKVGSYQPAVRKVVITGYAGDDAPIRAIRLSVDDYLMKPFSPEVFLKSVKSALLRYREGKERSNFLKTLSLVSLAAGRRMPDGERRAERMANTCLKIGRSFGLNPAQLEDLRQAAILHDLGFVSASDEGLSALSDDHGRCAAGILSNVQEAKSFAPLLLRHHEKYEIAGENIPPESRILAVAEAYEFFVSQKGMQPHEAMEALLDQSAKVYDPTALEIFSDLVLNPQMEAAQESEMHKLTMKSCEALLHLAQVYTLLGEIETAKAALSKLLRAESLIEDMELRFRIRLAFVRNLTREERLAEAEQEADKALQIALSANLSQHLVALLLIEIALVRLLRSSSGKVGELLEKACQIFEKFGDYLGLARGHLYFCFLFRQTGDEKREKDHFGRCVKIVEENKIQNFPVMEALVFKEYSVDFPPPLASGIAAEAAIRICCLGPLRVSRDGEILKEEVWKSKKAKVLLVYLLFNLGKSASETRLCDLFWPNTDPEKSRKNLHHIVYLLRRTLEPLLEDGNQSQYVLSNRNTYQFNPSSPFWWDVAEFKKVLEVARKGLDSADGNWLADVRKLENLYVGDLLEDYPDETWCDFEREKLKEAFLDVLFAASAYSEKKGELFQALEFSGRAFSLDPLREKSALRQFELLFKSGRRLEAIRKYQAWCEQLRKELNLSPSQEFLSAYSVMQGKFKS